MTKVQSGGLLLGIGIVLNVIGRLVAPQVRASQNVTFAGLLVVLMLASVVVGLFGIFRLIVGLLNR